MGTQVLKEVRKEWMNTHPSVKGWIERLAPATCPNYLRVAYEFFQWLKVNGGEFRGCEPEELLELQDKTLGRDRYKQLRLIQTWVSDQPVRLSTKRLMYAALRSFYAHNHVPLPRDPTWRARSEKEPVEHLLTVDELRQIIASSNVTYRAAFLCMFQGAMGCREFEYFNTRGWRQIEPQLRERQDRLKISFPGRKHAKNVKSYYSFIGKDATDALRKYLAEKRGKVHDGEPIILTERGDPITRGALERYFHRHAVKVGVLKARTPRCPKCGGPTVKVRRWTSKDKWKGPWTVYYVCRKCEAETPASELPQPKDIRYRMSPHEMRDLLRSEWELSPAKTVVAEFCMGHDIDPNMYNKIMRLHPDWAEAQYALAEPYLNIVSRAGKRDPRTVPTVTVDKLKERLNNLEEENRLLRERINGLLAMPAQERLATVEAEILKLKKTIGKLYEG